MQVVPHCTSKGRLAWKVVWCVEACPLRGKFKGEWRVKRVVVGRLTGDRAYRLWFLLRGKPWVLFGPEVWRGVQRVL